jgi:hypothetical protein
MPLRYLGRRQANIVIRYSIEGISQRSEENNVIITVLYVPSLPPQGQFRSSESFVPHPISKTNLFVRAGVDHL